MKYAYVAIEGVIFICYMAKDVFGHMPLLGGDISSATLKFLGITLCLAYSFVDLVRGYFKKYAFNKDRLVVTMAMLLTVWADSMLLNDGNYLSGVVLFILVQMIYLYRISMHYSSSSILKSSLIIRITLSGILVLLISIFLLEPQLIILAIVLYVVSFLDNIRILLTNYKCDRHTEHRLFLWGMVLFLLCDVNVAIYNIGDYITINRSILDETSRVAGSLMWFFYLPSQVMISLKSYKPK